MHRFVVSFATLLAVFAQLRSHPLGPGDASNGRKNVTGSVCYYKGEAHVEGEAIAVDEPCLSCRCRKGALTCSLRICTDVLDPPAPGCYIVHNANQCCPQVLCDAEKKESEIEVRTVAGAADPAGDNVCIVNGNAYAEGSALESSDSCEYCYCIGGRQKCIKPKCAMPFDGCKAMYSRNSCCPTQYDCRNAATSTNASRPTDDEKHGCSLRGRWYAEGEMVPRNESACENCYCMHGEVRCVPITCDTDISEDCEAIRQPGRCCPTSYVCSKVISGIPETQVRSLTKGSPTTEVPEQEQEEEEEEEGTELTTTVEETTATTAAGESTTYDDNLRGRTTDDGETATDVSFQGKTAEDATTTTRTTFEPDVSTVVPFTSRSIVVKSDASVANSRNNVDYPSENRTGLLDESATSLPPLQEQLFGSSSQSYDEYDAYDYNEPRLPPSLPNLIIFPFVAADAVVKDDEASKSPEYEQSASIKRVGTEPAFYKDYFSPPTKTEGGFVPKQPTNVDPYLESSYPGKDASFSFSHRPDRIPSELLLPSITMQPKTNSDQCAFKGTLYEHGELLSEPGDCQSCICYYGDVICQEIICPSLAEGCRRIADKETASCCGKVVCDGKGAEVVNFGQERTTKGRVSVQATPNPFRDVIRTEPAPDLPSLMGDLLPAYAEQQTKKPVTVTYKNLVVDYYPDFLVTTTTTREDVRKKNYNSNGNGNSNNNNNNNYNNPVYHATEVYPITNSLSDGPGTLDDDVTNPTVTNSVSASYDKYGHVSLRPDDANVRKGTEEYSPKVKHKYSTKTKSKTSTTVNKASTTETYDDDSFSLDSVLRFLFDFQTTTTTTPPQSKAATSASSSSSSSTTARKKFATSTISFPTGYDGEEEEERSRHTTRRTTPEYKYKDFDGDATDGNLQSKKQTALSGLLKLAGCNIYGRMYRVGKIIAELSNPCLECICTDFGVECNPLAC